MKKFSNGIIKARYLIFAILMVLFVGSIFLIPKVTINKDMTKYLPDNSSMKAGIDIINEEFPGTLDQKDIKIMFRDLQENEKMVIYSRLKTIDNVKKVTYDSSDNYNKGYYTLYVVTTDFNYKTPEEIQVEKDIKREFKDYDVIVQHVMYATTTIPPLVLIFAFTALTIILIIMCASWIDPILFLFTIGVAVCLNFGTNFFLPSVSESTFSLSAILQLVLSMDYSIILMNSYRQEKEETQKSPVECMKVAFSKAFPSIMGSGLTTIIGLLMLIFMQFKLGMDLGIVMAKGVALSMLCVFTILPTLIIWSDKLIFKLTKKQLHVRMRRVVRYEFNHRFQILVLFIVIFFGAMFFQSYTKITFAEVKNDQIGEVFTPTNNAIIVYDNEDEDKINNLMAHLNSDEDINLALSYKSTLALPMKAMELKEAIKQMGVDIDIPDKVIKMLYYDYYNQNKELLPLSIKTLFDTLVNEVVKDEFFGPLLDKEIKETILKLEPLVNKEFINKDLTVDELSNLSGVSKDQLGLLYSMAYALDNKDYVMKEYTLVEMIDHLKTNIIPNEMFSSFIPKELIDNINTLEKIANKTYLTTPINNIKISEFTGLPQNLVDNILMFKYGSKDELISIQEFISYTITDIIPSPTFSSYFDEASIKKLNDLNDLVSSIVYDINLSYKNLVKILYNKATIMDEMMLKVIYVYKDFLTDESKFKLSILNALKVVNNYLLSFPGISDVIPAETQTIIRLSYKIVNSINNDTLYTPLELANLIKGVEPRITEDLIKIGYLIHYSVNNYDDNYRMTLEEVINYLANDLINDNRFKDLINDEIKNMILLGQKMIVENKSMLVGDKHSLIVLDLKVSEESLETTEFFDRLDKLCKDNLEKEFHFVGEAAMNVEMEKGFNRDLVLITILTAVAIFIIVALTFKSLLIPLILVLIVQCGVFMTVCISGIISNSIYYLALLIVQCILMGATIDYGIVFTNYYKENRKTMEIGPALDIAYGKSLHTILTSGLIIVLVTGLIGLGPTDPAIAQICLTLSFGTLCAILLILFILPGIIMVFDKYIIKEHKNFFKRKKNVE